MRGKKFPGWGAVILLLLGIAGILFVRPAYHWVKAWLEDNPVPHDLPSGYVDDASRLNSTDVAEVWSIPAEPAAAETQLRALLHRAQTGRMSVAIGGALAGRFFTPPADPLIL